MRTAHHSVTANTPLASDQPRRMPCSPSHNHPVSITAQCATSPAWSSAVGLVMRRVQASDMGIPVQLV